MWTREFWVSEFTKVPMVIPWLTITIFLAPFASDSLAISVKPSMIRPESFSQGSAQPAVSTSKIALAITSSGGNSSV